MDLNTIISITTIASVAVLGGALYYTGRARGGVSTMSASGQVPVWKTSTTVKVEKPRRWREQILAGHNHPVEQQRQAV